jgi:hypothetical protein
MRREVRLLAEEEEAAAVQWVERIMRKIDNVFSGCGYGGN